LGRGATSFMDVHLAKIGDKMPGPDGKKKDKPSRVSGKETREGYDNVEKDVCRPLDGQNMGHGNS